MPLGTVRFTEKNGRRIPIHGSIGGPEGVTKFAEYCPNNTTLEPSPASESKPVRYLMTTGYPVTGGRSFIMVLEFTDAGPRAQAFLIYSESGDPASPLFAGQTELFSAKKWRPVLFTEEQVKSD